jgi:hypothetical protein
MENNKRLNYDLLDLEISNHKNQKNHSSDNVPPLRLRSSFRNPCQQGVHKKALDIMLMFRLLC